jgi:hypothetical protein
MGNTVFNATKEKAEIVTYVSAHIAERYSKLKLEDYFRLAYARKEKT